MSRHPPPSSDEERDLREDLLSGKPGAVERLALSALGFVVKVSMEYQGQGLPLEELVNEGNVGLMEAARRFDPSRGVRFTTYAVWWIRKAILQALSRSRLVPLPLYQTRRLQRIRSAESTLRRKLGRRPSREEIAAQLAEKSKLLEETLRLRPLQLSISAATDRDDERTLEASLPDTRASSPEMRLVERERGRVLADALALLPERERLVLTLRYGLSTEGTGTLREIAQRLGISRERVRQIENDAKEHIRRRLMMRDRARPRDRRRATSRR